jgi:hypothetical protein
VLQRAMQICTRPNLHVTKHARTSFVHSSCSLSLCHCPLSSQQRMAPSPTSLSPTRNPPPSTAWKTATCFDNTTNNSLVHSSARSVPTPWSRLHPTRFQNHCRTPCDQMDQPISTIVIPHSKTWVFLDGVSALVSRRPRQRTAIDSDAADDGVLKIALRLSATWTIVLERERVLVYPYASINVGPRSF